MLILHDDPSAYFDQLRARFPETSFALARPGEAAATLLDRVRPTVAFAVRCPSQPLSLRRDVAAHPGLRWFQNAGVGVEPLLACAHKELLLTNAVGVLSGHLAETVIGALLALNLGLPAYARQQQARTWEARPFTGLAGKTLALIGLGGVGRAVAARAQALGLRVIGVNRSGRAVPEVAQVYPVSRLGEVVAQADFLSLHTVSTPQTRHLISAELLDAMKPTAFLLNTARGAIVDEAALIDRLRRKTIAGAYLDVFEVEPLPQDSPLWAMETVILTPHCADSVTNWQVEMADFFADNLARWLAGKPLKNVVDPARGY